MDRNEGQERAIRHDKGPLLIIAGPGTGKTYTLVKRFLYLVLEKGVAPEKILVCTFTEKAAKELITRLTDECDKNDIHVDLNAMYIGTIHSLCLRIIKENVEYLSDFNKNFRMLDEKTQSYIVHSNLHFFYERFGGKEAFVAKLKPFQTFTRSSDWITFVICNLVNKFSEEMVDPDLLISSAATPGFLDPYRELFGDFEEDQTFLDQAAFLGELLKAYEELSIEKGFLDFSSIQTKCYRLLEKEEVLARIQEKIEYLMVDEYQDTNYIQEQLMFRLAGEARNLCVVGDDDQALYRFRGATVRNILEFPEKMEKLGAHCEIVRIETNYRSDPGIVKLYNRWMDSPYQFQWSDGDRLYRHPKQIRPDKKRAEIPNAVLKISGEGYAQRICDFIKRLKDTGKISDYNQVVLLSGSVDSIYNEANANLIECFEENGIPIFAPRSGKFFFRREVKLAIGILKKLLYVYEEDVEEKNAKSILRILGHDDKELNFANEVLDEAENAELKSWVEETVASFRAQPDERQYSDFTYTELLYRMYAFEPFRSLMGTDSEGNAYDTRAVRNLAILTQLTGEYEEIRGIPIINPGDLGQAQSFFDHYLAQIKSGRMEEYESEIDYAPSGCVSYMTIHQSKGMQFPVVITLLDQYLLEDKDGALLIRMLENIYHQAPYEPGGDIAKFDFFRKFYVAFSRAQNMLVLVDRVDRLEGRNGYYFRRSHESFAGLVKDIAEYDENTDLEAFQFEKIKPTEIKPTLSFTSHIAKYDECPREYMFLKEFEFSPVKAGSYVFGTLVHQTIEDVHRAALRGEEHLITDANIEAWFHANYAALSKIQNIHGMTPRVRAAALEQVKRYVARRAGDWSMIRETEVDVSLVKEDYIMGGTIDLIQGDDDSVELVDFKSESNPLFLPEQSRRDKERKERELGRLERYRKQLRVYAHLVEERTGRKVSAMNLYYTGEPGNDYIVRIPYERKDVEGSIEEFDATAQKILHKEYAVESGCDRKACEECSFRYYCAKI